MRIVKCMDALEWMEDSNEGIGPVVTSPPDMAETDMDFEHWVEWFAVAVQRCMYTSGSIFPTVFYVTDRRYEGRLVSKAATIMEVAQENHRRILWHKIALRRDVGKTDIYRPTYSHLIAVGGPSTRPGPQSPDVFPRGKVLYGNGMGAEAARLATRFVESAGIVYNPFCGRGTVLAAADEIGIDAVGIDNDQAQCELAEGAKLPPCESAQTA